MLNIQPPGNALAAAKRHFRADFQNGAARFNAARVCAAKGRLRDAEGNLRDAAVLWYRCVISVYTLKVPDATEVASLHVAAEHIVPQLADVWLGDNAGDRMRFDKLVGADFRISLSQPLEHIQQELGWFDAKLEQLGSAVHEACCQRIAQMEAG